jgi:hypothetical protein
MPDARLRETPQRERENSGAGNSQANSPTQGGRKVTTYRWAGTTENNGEDAKSREGLATAAPSENNTPPEPRGSSAVRSARPTQEQRKAQPPSSGMSPRVEPYYRPNKYVEQGPGATERPNNNTSGFAETPRTESNRTYRSPQQESAPLYKAPRVESAPSPPAPRIERTRDPVPLRQSAPSMNRDSGPGTHPTPSQNRSGGNPGASSAGKSGENRPAGASAGGEAQGRNRK